MTLRFDFDPVTGVVAMSASGVTFHVAQLAVGKGGGK